MLVCALLMKQNKTKFDIEIHSKSINQSIQSCHSMNKNDDSYLLYGCHKCKMYIIKIVVGVFHIRPRFLSTFITKINVKYSEQQNTQSIFLFK